MDQDPTRWLPHRSSASKSIAQVAVLLLFVVAGIAIVGGQPAANDGRISEFSYSGDGRITPVGEESDVWLSEQHQFTVAISSTEGLSDAAVCLVVGVESEEDEQTLVCESTTVPAESTREVTVPVESWPANLTGGQTVRAVLKVPNESGEVADTESLSLTVIRKEDDLDGDGLTNEREVSLETDLRAVDTDGDGLGDTLEVDTHGTSPTNADTDGDGLSDRAELEDEQTDPTDTDTDGDGLQDDKELELGTNPNREDTDGDGLTDGEEVNTYDTDPTEADTDGDGLDDGAEITQYDTNPISRDTDDDGLTDNLEVNTYGTDPREIDTDGDGLTDGKEVDDYGTDPAESDSDGDGVDDGAETNTYGTNPTVADTDGDGLTDGEEVDEYETDPNAADSDGDGVSDRNEVDTGAIDWPSPPVLGGLSVVVVGSVGLLYAIFRRRRFESLSLPFAVNDGHEGETDDRRSDEDVPPEFLPNYKRVVTLLDEHDGRIRQSEIVKETGWSKSKVSRILSEMEEEGQIAKIDIGRGNVIARPEDVPPGMRSSFDE